MAGTCRNLHWLSECTIVELQAIYNYIIIEVKSLISWSKTFTYYLEFHKSFVCILGAEVYERLHRHRQEDKSRRKMLDDILVHIQVISGVSTFFEFFLLYRSKWQRSKLFEEVICSGLEHVWSGLSRSCIVDNLVLLNGLIMWIGHRKEIQKLAFRALALRRTDTATQFLYKLTPLWVLYVELTLTWRPCWSWNN